jgi:hypothetical protein
MQVRVLPAILVAGFGSVGVTGSIPLVVFSLSGKVPVCATGEQGSSPGDNRKMTGWLIVQRKNAALRTQ